MRSSWSEFANGRDEHAGPLAPTQQVVRREDCPECLKQKSGRCGYCQAAGLNDMHGGRDRDPGDDPYFDPDGKSCGCGERPTCATCGNCRDCCQGLQDLSYKITPRPEPHTFQPEEPE